MAEINFWFSLFNSLEFPLWEGGCEALILVLWLIPQSPRVLVPKKSPSSLRSLLHQWCSSTWRRYKPFPESFQESLAPTSREAWRSLHQLLFPPSFWVLFLHFISRSWFIFVVFLVAGSPGYRFTDEGLPCQGNRTRSPHSMVSKFI